MRKFLAAVLALSAMNWAGAPSASAEDIDSVLAHLPCTAVGAPPAAPRARPSQEELTAAAAAYTAWTEQLAVYNTCVTQAINAMSENERRLVDSHNALNRELQTAQAAWQAAQQSIGQGN